MKKTLVFILLSVFCLASFASAQGRFNGSLEQALAKAKAENKLVIIDFFSAG